MNSRGPQTTEAAGVFSLFNRQRLFRQQVRPPPAHMPDATESPGGSVSECGGSPESFKLDVIPMERDGDEAHSLSDKVHLQSFK